MSNKTVSDETIRFLIEQKMSYVNSTVNVCMLWWVSSIAFCGYVLAAVWSYREQLSPVGYVIGLGIILYVFFFFIAYFGILMADRLMLVQKEIAVIANEVNYDTLDVKMKDANLRPHGGFLYTEIVTFKRAMMTGALSFTLVFASWIFFWSALLYKFGLRYVWVSFLWTVIWLSLWCIKHRRAIPRWWRWMKEIIQPG